MIHIQNVTVSIERARDEGADGLVDALRVESGAGILWVALLSIFLHSSRATSEHIQWCRSVIRVKSNTRMQLQILDTNETRAKA